MLTELASAPGVVRLLPGDKPKPKVIKRAGRFVRVKGSQKQLLVRAEELAQFVPDPMKLLRRARTAGLLINKAPHLSLKMRLPGSVRPERLYCFRLPKAR
jgi:hypothetical protein